MLPDSVRWFPCLAEGWGRVLAAVFVLSAAVGCATQPPRPYSAADANKLGSIEVRIWAANDPLSVDTLMNAPVIDSSGYIGASANPIAAGLGAGIAAEIIYAIETERAKSHAQELRTKLGDVPDQAVATNYRALLAEVLGKRLRAASPERIGAITLVDDPQTEFTMAKSVRAAESDAVLFVNVTQVFADRTTNAVGGKPAPLSMQVSASVLFARKDGTELIKDRIVFIAPQSEDASDVARTSWWRENRRYAAVLDRSASAFAAVLEQLVFSVGSPTHLGTPIPQRAGWTRRLNTKDEPEARRVIERLQKCDNFHGTSASDTRFEFYRSREDADLAVGIVCAGSQAKSG